MACSAFSRLCPLSGVAHRHRAAVTGRFPLPSRCLRDVMAAPVGASASRLNVCPAAAFAERPAGRDGSAGLRAAITIYVLSRRGRRDVMLSRVGIIRGGCAAITINVLSRKGEVALVQVGMARRRDRHHDQHPVPQGEGGVIVHLIGSVVEKLRIRRGLALTGHVASVPLFRKGPKPEFSLSTSQKARAEDVFAQRAQEWRI